MIYKGKESEEIVGKILESLNDDGRYPLHEGDCGYFINKNGVWTAWDNLTGDCWVEDFKTEQGCLKWISNG